MKSFNQFNEDILNEIAIGKTYKIKHFDPTKNTDVEKSVKVTDFKKGPGMRNVVHYSHGGKIYKMPSGAFKKRMIDGE